MVTHTHTSTGSRKYEPLTKFLRRQTRAVVCMSFDEIERVIGAKLPPSATNSRAWWSNNPSNSVMTKAWRDAGFKSEDVDMKGRQVTFRHVRPEAPRDTATPSIDATSEGRHPLIGWLKGTVTIASGVDLTGPADPHWGEAAYGEWTGAERE